MRCLATASARKQGPRATSNALNTLRRFWTAWSRYHHSSGFGIHSPYAYRFVRSVWSQSLPYYAYDGLHQLLGVIGDGMTRSQRQAMDLISEREARLLFRVTNFFNPARMLQAGAATAVESVAMLEVSRRSMLHLYDPQLEQKPVAVRVLHSQLDRVECYDDATVAVNELLETGDAPLLALINIPIDVALLKRLIDARCVMVMRNLNRSTAMSALFDECCRHMTSGQTYTNTRIAILNPDPKLQREDFVLWLKS